MQPSIIKNYILLIMDFVFKDLITAVFFFLLILVIFWIAMKNVLNMDDTVWGVMTFAMMVFFMVLLLVAIDEGYIDLGSIFTYIKSLL